MGKDYAAQIESLRELCCSCGDKAADAIEALLKERDQTCRNCKHWESYQGDPPICKNIKVTSLLSSGVHNGGTEYLEPPADFGCNRWEAKV